MARRCRSNWMCGKGVVSGRKQAGDRVVTVLGRKCDQDQPKDYCRGAQHSPPAERLLQDEYAHQHAENYANLTGRGDIADLGE